MKDVCYAEARMKFKGISGILLSAFIKSVKSFKHVTAAIIFIL